MGWMYYSEFFFCFLGVGGVVDRGKVFDKAATVAMIFGGRGKMKKKADFFTLK